MNEYFEELNELPVFYNSIEEYEVNDDRFTANHSRNGLLYYSTDICDNSNNPTKPIGKGQRMKNATPQKPKTQKEQISMLWDILFNRVIHRQNFQDTKINFILGFMVLILGLLGFLAIAFMIGQ